MTNDFPMNALPEGPGRLGLMVRPKEWVMYNSGMGSAVDALTGSAPIDAAPGLRADLEQVGQQLKAEGCYPVRSPFDLMMTSVQTMMDANLALQIKGALRTKPNPNPYPNPTPTLTPTITLTLTLTFTLTLTPNPKP